MLVWVFFFLWSLFFPIAKFHLTAFPKEHKEEEDSKLFKTGRGKIDLVEDYQLHTFCTSFWKLGNLDLGKKYDCIS